jgi:hypothetical protein
MYFIVDIFGDTIVQCARWLILYEGFLVLHRFGVHVGVKVPLGIMRLWIQNSPPMDHMKG